MLFETAHITINLRQVCNFQDQGDRIVIRQSNEDRFTITVPEELALLREWIDHNTIRAFPPVASFDPASIKPNEVPLTVEPGIVLPKQTRKKAQK